MADGKITALQIIPVQMKQEGDVAHIKNTDRHFERRGGAVQILRKKLTKAEEVLNSVVEDQAYTTQELIKNNSDLNTAYNDLNNIVRSLNLPIILLGPTFKIRMVSPSAELRFNLEKKNGKSIFSVKFPLGKTKLKEVLDFVVREVKSYRVVVKSVKGYWYSLRISPYKLSGNQVDGVVMVFVGIDQLKRSLERLKQSKSKLKKREQYFIIPFVRC